MATYVGNAEAPAGFWIVGECPSMETDAEMNKMNALVGKMGLFGWDNSTASGWYMGKIQRFGGQPLRPEGNPDRELRGQVHLGADG